MGGAHFQIYYQVWLRDCIMTNDTISSETDSNNSIYQMVVKWGNVYKGLSTVLGKVNITIFIIIFVLLWTNHWVGWDHRVHWGLNVTTFVNLLA